MSKHTKEPAMRFRFLGSIVLLHTLSFSLAAQEWQRFPPEGFTNDWVVDMAYFQGDLYACGFFTLIGGVEANHIARWNGQEWEPMGTGLNDHAHSLFIFEDHLYVTGYFTNAGGEWVNHLGRWDGEQWTDLGGGFDGPTLGIGSYQGDLIVSGEFSLAGNTGANGIAKWNGIAWEPLGEGFSDPWSPFDIFPHALLEWEGSLLASGNFRKAGGQQVNGIARWDGSDWQPMGTGFNADVLGMVEYQGQLLAGGSFTQSGGGNLARGIARWNGWEWEPLPGQNGGVGGWVHTLKVFDDELYIAGGFPETASVPPTPLNNIARWTEDGWEPLGNGLNNAAEAMILYNDHLLVGGDFTFAGDELAFRLAAWGAGTVGFPGEPTKKLLQVIPNPTFDQWNIQAEVPMQSVRITDALGRTVFSNTFQKKSISIAANHLPAGLYWACLTFQDATVQYVQLIRNK